MNVDKIITSIPINETAGNVVRKGEHYEPKIKNKTVVHLNVQPIIKPISKSQRKNKLFINLTGRQFGRFTVIGISADVPKRWVVKCVCGKYELRTAKACKGHNPVVDRCVSCMLTKGMISRKRNHEKWIAGGALKRELGEK